MKNKGFTLIELAIVLLVIGILVGIVLKNIGSQGIQARDTRRVADLRNVSIYLAQYLSKEGNFPKYTDIDWDGTGANKLLGELQSKGVTQSLPTTPSGTKYEYYACSDSANTPRVANHYVLKTVLEETKSQNQKLYEGTSASDGTPWPQCATNGNDITTTPNTHTPTVAPITCKIDSKEYCLTQ